MEIQTDQGLLVLNLENVQALHQMSKGNCIYTLAVANSENDGTTMVQIPVSLQCNGNSINFQNTFSNDTPISQQPANIQQYTQQFDQAQVSEELQCLLQSNEESSLVQKPSYLENTILNIAPEPTLNQHHEQVYEESSAPDNEEELEVDHQAIYNYIDSNIVPRFASEKYIKTLKKRSRNYSIVDKTLYHGVAKLRKVIVDREVQERLLKESHIVSNSGVHLGVKKMYSAITASYFWKEVYMDVANYVRQCEGCSERAAGETSDQPSNLETTSIDSNVWKTVEAQMHGPFNKTYQGYEYLLTISDPISHWIVALPITNKELPIRMANFIFETFCTFGFAQCRVINACVKNFAVVQDVFEEASGTVKGACKDLCRTESRLCTWVEDLIGGLVADHPDTWDRELPAFLFKYRVAAGDNGSPFVRMLHRSGKICSAEEKENRELNEEQENPEGTRKRRRLQSSILQCRHCEDSFTSKISFRIHQRKHVADARRRGILEGQESSCVLLDSETKRPRNSASKRNARLNRSSNLTKFITNRLDQLLANRNNELRVNLQTPLPKDDREELKANTLAAVRNMLALTRDKSRRRGRYHKFPSEIQEEMARYAVKNGNMSAVTHFSELLGCVVSESTVRNIVRANQKFPPELKEEIGRYATAFGVKASSAFYTESLGMKVRHSLVRKFQNEYVRRYPEVASCAEAALKNSETAQNEVCLSATNGNVKSRSKQRYHTNFTPELCEEIGSYASQFAISDTIQHFSPRFLLKKTTVLKYRKMYLEKTQPIEFNDLQENSAVPSTSQTINIMNASLNLLNNPQLSNPTTTAISGNSYQPLPADETRSLLYSSVPSMASYSKQINPSSSNQNTGLFLQNPNSELPLQSDQNDFDSFNPPSQSGHKKKSDSFFELSAATHFSDDVMFRDSQSHTMTPLTAVVPSSCPLSSSRATCSSLSPTSTLFVLPALPVRQVTEIPQATQEYHKPVDPSNTNQIMYEKAKQLKDSTIINEYLSVNDGRDEQEKDITGFDRLMLDNDLQGIHDPEFSDAVNVSILKPQARQRQIIPRSAKKSKSICAPQLKSKTVATESEDEDDPDSGSDSLPVANKKRVELPPRRKKCERKEVIEKRGAYTIYSPEIRARMGKYAVEHGNQRTCEHFGSLLGHVIPESTVRGLRDKYLLKREQLSSVKNVTAEVNSLGYFPRGRPMRLGKYDELVQDCVRELIKSGEKVSTALVIATAKQVLSQNEPSLLEENGGSTTLTVTWAKSFMRRIGVRNNC